MKVIGLIGGMSWESTAEYYRIINKTIKERLGGLHSAKILLYSVDFSEEDSPLPLFDTTAIHAQAAVNFALEDGQGNFIG
jgi:amino-acid racemase